MKSCSRVSVGLVVGLGVLIVRGMDVFDYALNSLAMRFLFWLTSSR